jgi:hypothetical protein
MRANEFCYGPTLRFRGGPGTGLPDGVHFIPKIPIWVNFGGPWIGKCWHVYVY